MIIKHDGNLQNPYIETCHTRVTLVLKRPNQDKDWTGGTTIRFQAKRGNGGLHMGAEIPLEDIPDITAGLASLLISGLEAPQRA